VDRAVLTNTWLQSSPYKQAGIFERSCGPSLLFSSVLYQSDGSWGAEWNTFRGVKRFVAPWGAILEYFTGIAPPEYYAVKADRDQKSRDLDERRRDKQQLERARERVNRSMALQGPKLSAENFELEIESLTREVTELNGKQEDLRNAVVREEELLANLNLQSRLATEALETYDSDAVFLQKEHAEALVCPTCGAEHTRSFLDLLTYAEDARVLRELAVRLQEEARQLREKNRSTRTALHELEVHYERVNGILQTRRGEMRFGDVVKSMGAETAFRAFEDEKAVLLSEIEQLLGAIDSLEERLSELRSPKRSKPILASFRDYYRSARAALNLQAVDVSRMRLTSRPNLSGSGGPRSILAYYAALWRTCHAEEAPYSVPVVIDSPNQQGQDDVNLPAVLKFIAQDLPPNTQLLVGLETMPDYTFDNVVELEEPYSLLRTADEPAVRERLMPLVEVMYRGLTEN
jgi:hypothetical protein